MQRSQKSRLFNQYINMVTISSILFAMTIQFTIIKISSETVAICYPTSVPYLFGGYGGDAKILSIDMPSNANSANPGDMVLGGSSNDPTLLNGLTAMTPFIAYIENGGNVLYANYYTVSGKTSIQDVQFCSDGGSTSKGIALFDSHPLTFFTLSIMTGSVIQVFVDTYPSYAATTSLIVTRSSVTTWMRSYQEFAIGMQSPDNKATLFIARGSIPTFYGYRESFMNTHFTSVFYKSPGYEYILFVSGVQYINGQYINTLSAIDIASQNALWTYGSASTHIDIACTDLYATGSIAALVKVQMFSCSNKVDTLTPAALHVNYLGTSVSYISSSSHEAHYTLPIHIETCLATRNMGNQFESSFLFQGTVVLYYCIFYFGSSLLSNPSTVCSTINISNLGASFQIYDGVLYKGVENAYIAGYVHSVFDSTHLASTSFSSGFILTLNSTQSCQTTLVYGTSAITPTLISGLLSTQSFPSSYSPTFGTVTVTSTSMQFNFLSNSNCPIVSGTYPDIKIPIYTPQSVCVSSGTQNIYLDEFYIPSTCDDCLGFTYEVEQVDSLGNIIGDGSLLAGVTFSDQTKTCSEGKNNGASNLKLTFSSSLEETTIYVKVQGYPINPYLSIQSYIVEFDINYCTCWTVVCYSCSSSSNQYTINSPSISIAQTPLFKVTSTNPNCLPTITAISTPSLPSGYSFTFPQVIGSSQTSYQTALTSIFSSSESDVGSYSIEIKAIYQGTTRSKTYSLTIHKSCASASIALTTVPTLPSTFSFDILDPSPQTILTYSYLVAPSTCLIGSLVETLSDNAHFVTVTGSSIQTAWSSSGSYSGSLTIVLVDTVGANIATIVSNTFAVTVTDQCLNNAIATPTISTQVYNIGVDNILSFTFADFFVSGATVTCSQFVYTYRVLKAGVTQYSNIGSTYSGSFIQVQQVSGSGNARIFQFDVQTTDMAYAYSSYIVEITGTMSNGRVQIITFALNLLNLCATASYSHPALAVTAYSYNLRSAPQTISLPAFFTSSQSNSVCGSFTYRVVQYWASLNSDYFAFDPSTLIFAITLTKPLPSSCGIQPVASCSFFFQIQGYQGSYSANIQPLQINKPAIYSDFQIQIIDPCVGTGIDPTGPFVTDYNISDPSITFVFGSFAATFNSGNCGEFSTPILAFTSSMLNQGSVITYPSTSTGYSGFDIVSTNPSDEGIISFFISVSLQDYLPPTPITQNVQFTVNIKKKPVCNITMPLIQDLTYSITDTSLSVLLPAPYDSSDYACQSTVTQILIGDDPLDSSIFSTSNIGGNKYLNVYTSNVAKEGVFQINMLVTNNGSNQSSFFYVFVDCSVSLIEPTLLRKKVYTIGTKKLQYKFDDFELTPNCKKDISYELLSATSNPLPPCVSLDSSSRTISVDCFDPLTVGTYQVSVQAQLVNSDGSLLVSAPSIFDLIILPNALLSKNDTNQTANITVSIDFGSNNTQNGEPVLSLTISSKSAGNLNATITSISATGVMLVSFESPIIPQTNTSSYNNSIIHISLEPESTDIDPKYLGLTWQILLITQLEMQVQLNFSSPLQISNKCRVKLEFIDTDKFVDKNTKIQIDQNYTLSKYIPSMLVNDGASQALLAGGAIFSGVMNAATIGSFVVNVFLSSSMQFLWAVLNALQIIVHIPLFTLDMPTNANLFFFNLVSVVQFDILPSTKIFALIFNFSNDTTPFNSQYEFLGYSGVGVINNLGSIYLFIMGLITILLFMTPIKFLILKSKKRIPLVIFQKVAKTITVLTLYRLLIESYIELAICSVLNITNIRKSNASDMYESLFAFLTFTVVIGLIVLQIGLATLSFEKLESKNFKEKLGIFYLEFKYYDRTSLFYNLFFYSRRLIFAIMANFCGEYTLIQIQILLYSQMIVILHLAYFKPFEETLTNKMELYNEVTITVVVYLLFLFTDFLPEKEKQYMVGYIVIAIVLLNIVINTGIIVQKQSSVLIRFLRLRLKMRRRRQSVGKVLKKIQPFNMSITSLADIKNQSTIDLTLQVEDLCIDRKKRDFFEEDKVSTNYASPQKNQIEEVIQKEIMVNPSSPFVQVSQYTREQKVKIKREFKQNQHDFFKEFALSHQE